MPRKRRSSPIKTIGFILLALMLSSAAALAWVLERAAVPPRQLGPYIERRAEGHRYDQVGAWVARAMNELDRGQPISGVPPLRAGAQAAAQAPAKEGLVVLVSDPESAITAIEKARSGDIITFAPGAYLLRGRSYVATSPAAGVTVRAERPGTVFIQLAMTEGFLVRSPDWTFENLDIRGACSRHDNCEHAFHVVGAATGFVARNNTILDFNAHFKINGKRGLFPDNGVIENNSLSNTAVRKTGHPVVPVDLVAASNWSVRGNLITDFIKSGGDFVSYGGFFKGGGNGNRFSRNVVICENLLHGAKGQRVGLSLGGGGTTKTYCRDQRCLTEQDRGTIESNLIVSCSDEGIYLNRAAASKVTHNTLLDTAGVSARWPESTADIEGNIIDGRIRARDGALVRHFDNLDTSVTRLFTGAHPQRELYATPQRLDLRWRGAVPRRASAEGAGSDLCGSARPAQPAYGAFEDFSACLLK